ncbi:3-keto-disaccharide hydrolase [Paludisphaera borealis]|uniref:3-keto-alpha-glucoside-1,2-lyase/3-keto-2-hydroxy-glucal hydratase domain-containing protein n=1 Tax=Paludisphaera borealis TaxID=1387353 RepID=A0A1U7CMS8_9BACT|nr:DUF1080 domain-containing protein [Paludisphaera borealis]APW60240.1 putative beta-jelly-roll-type glycoside hydrolase of unknown function [Paludisphaera borealis]
MRIAIRSVVLVLSFGLAVALADASAAPPARSAADAAPVSLFNGKDLSGWTIHLNHSDKSDPKADPKGVFQVKDGVIHVSGEEFGCLTTDKEFDNYKVSLEFKWGEKRWPPRENAVRDSGILVHVVGPDKVWPRSVECQIQEHDCGDFYLVDGATIVIDGKLEKQYKKKSADHEKPNGEWNTVEVVCDGGTVTNIINGKIVNTGTDASEKRGKIVLQSEGAELFFRNVVLTPLK